LRRGLNSGILLMVSMNPADLISDISQEDFTGGGLLSLAPLKQGGLAAHI
jgi:hypothetical protein